MRKEAAHRSEMVSQLLFGEFAELLQKEKDFSLVRSLHDGYEGWCQNSQLEGVARAEETHLYTRDLSHRIGFGDSCMDVPLATPVYGLAPEFEWKVGGKQVWYFVSGEEIWDSSIEAANATQLQWVAYNYLNTPYLWGGRSLYGIDCSGFVQQVFKFFGIKLPRDAWQQAGVGEDVRFEDLRTGDLCFFKNENDRITHVGLVIDDSKIIHASGRVRVDGIRADGIYHSETGERTHELHSVKRCLEIG